jgi:hypothetical protein
MSTFTDFCMKDASGIPMELATSVTVFSRPINIKNKFLHPSPRNSSLLGQILYNISTSCLQCSVIDLAIADLYLQQMR